MKSKLQGFIKSYIQVLLIVFSVNFLLGPSEDVSMLWVSFILIPITALFTFTGLEERLKKTLP